MSEWAPPEEFDDYVIERPLGQGSMGRVYLAHDAVLARPVAVKFIAAVEPDAASRQRFLLEARATARLQHPNVVAIYRVGELDAKPYIVTEFVRGDTLDTLPLPLAGARVLELGVELARGLAAAHRRGVIHGDIKPANAIVSEDGTAKLLDFGLATLADAAPAGRARAIVGTPDYMAPELWRGAPADRRSDVYALGAMLHHLLTGNPPFHAVPPRDLARVVQDKDAPRLELGSGNARLAAVVDRCLARDPAERWASGDELREALEQCRAQAAAAPVLPGGNPYRGLRPFEADHRLLFFGRTSELGVMIDRLRAEPFLLVSGDSGSGKSSLCRAAVLPAIGDGAIGDGRTWASIQLVPGRRPLRALAAALAPALELGEDLVATNLRGDGAGIRAMFRDRLGAGRGLVVFVDQLEELATIADADEAAAADRALARLGSSTPGLRLLATVRADFLGRLAALPDLGEQLTRALVFLRPLGPDEIREVIVGPAEATGVRFETTAMVDELVAATAGADGGLPLLQFALAELWTARDPESGVITAAALASLGGVEGALARHADSVVAALTPAQRTAARRSLTRLVTSEGTRARRSEAELGTNPATRAALDALVRGRLLVAHEADDGSAYELSHEVLVRGWGTLRDWLVEDADQRMLLDRVHQAAKEWERLRRGRDALWGPRQLDEAMRVREAELQPLDREFLVASRRRVRRRRWALRGGIVAVPALIVTIYFGVAAANRRALDREVDGLRAVARRALADADAKAPIADDLRARALAAFDANDPGAEAAWQRATAADQEVDRALSKASRRFEIALARDPGRGDNRADLGKVLLRLALRADATHADAERDTLIERVTVYDTDRTLMTAWNQAATLRLAITPAAARVELQRYDATGRTATTDRIVDAHATVTVAPGLYRLVVSADGFAPVLYPVLARRGTTVNLAFAMPPAAQVPAGFRAVPAGEFLFGWEGDPAVRQSFYSAQPLHTRRTDGYLIAIHEVTFGDSIRFLDALPVEARAAHLPLATDNMSGAGTIALRAGPAGWTLELTRVDGVRVAVRTGEVLPYPARPHHAGLDWSRLPVTGVSSVEMTAYMRWLDQHGVPGARLCSELEWERAARGADDRLYPTGREITPADANFDETYGHHSDQMGLDEVGSHPGSDSPFGIADTLGNAFELTSSAMDPGLVGRGGSFFYDPQTCHLPNRNPFTPAIRNVMLGFRVCVSWPR